LVAVDGGEDFGGGVVEADVADGGFGQTESGEGLSVNDGVGKGDGEGGFAGFGKSGEEDEGVFDEEEKYRLELSRMKSVGWEPDITLHEGVSRILKQLGRRTQG
jgi:hypothetical protein